MSIDTERLVATQHYRVYVKASPDTVWDALTRPELSELYGYRSRIEVDLRPGGVYRLLSNEGMKAMGAPEVMVEGEVLDVQPGRRIVHTWHALFNDETSAEPETHVTWEIAPAGAGVARISLAHELHGAPTTAGFVGGRFPGTGGGWAMILSDLKSLLETGSPLIADGSVDMAA